MPFVVLLAKFFGNWKSAFLFAACAVLGFVFIDMLADVVFAPVACCVASFFGSAP